MKDLTANVRIWEPEVRDRLEPECNSMELKSDLPDGEPDSTSRVEPDSSCVVLVCGFDEVMLMRMGSDYRSWPRRVESRGIGRQKEEGPGGEQGEAMDDDSSNCRLSSSQFTPPPPPPPPSFVWRRQGLFQSWLTAIVKFCFHPSLQ